MCYNLLMFIVGNSATRRGFTIVELLVAIVIIAILATVGVVAYGTIRQRAYDSKVDAILNQVGKAIENYVTKGNSIRLKHYAISDFYAAPGGGWTDQGLPVYSGGGLGVELANKGMLVENLQNSLAGGPTRDLSLKNRIKTVSCGKSKMFIIIEAYSGISESDLQQKMRNLDCAWKTEKDWRNENNLPLPSGWGTASGTYRVQPNYKYLELDL